MFLILLTLGLEFTFVVQRTTLYITGSGTLSSSEVMANCDYQTITDIYVGEGCSAFTSGVFYNFVNLRNLYLPSTLQTTTGGDTRYCWNFANIYLPSESQYLEWISL